MRVFLRRFIRAKLSNIILIVLSMKIVRILYANIFNIFMNSEGYYFNLFRGNIINWDLEKHNRV